MDCKVLSEVNKWFKIKRALAGITVKIADNFPTVNLFCDSYLYSISTISI